MEELRVDAVRRRAVVAARRHVPAVVTAAIGERVVGARHMPYGHASVTFEVDTPARTVVVRTSTRRGAFVATCHNIEVLRALGVAVPSVLALGDVVGDTPVEWMVLEHVPGRDLGLVVGSLDAPQKRAVAARVADAQARVAAGVPMAATYGYAAIGTEPGRAGFRDVVDDILALTERTLPGRLAARLDVARRRLDELTPHLDGVAPRCFLDDAQMKNVIVDDGVFRGIVDLDTLCYGDVLLCAGLTQTAVFHDVGERALDYVDELLHAMQVDPSLREVVDAYSAVFALEFLRDGNIRRARERRLVAQFDRWAHAVP